MDGLKEFGEFISDKLFQIPFYYNEKETTFSIGIGLLSLVISFFVIRRIIEQTTTRLILAAGVAALCFLLYNLYLNDVGGALIAQTLCRILFFGSLGFMVPVKKSDEEAD
jgi:hypothetical protein